MKLKAILALTCALAIGVIAAGCGGGDDEDSTTTAEITQADFVAQGNQICAQANAEIDQAGQQLGDSVDEATLESFASDTVVPNVQGQIDDIKALGAPDGQQAQIDAMLAAAQSGVDALTADPSQIKDDTLFDDANAKADAIGLTECSG